MKIKKIVLLISVITCFGVVTYFSLNSLFSCPNLKNAYFSEITYLSTSQSHEYCDCLTYAMRGEPNAIVKFSTYEFDSASGYAHGNNVKALVDYLGEDKYLAALLNITRYEKKIIFNNFSINYYLNLLNRKDADSQMMEDYPNLVRFLISKRR